MAGADASVVLLGGVGETGRQVISSGPELVKKAVLQPDDDSLIGLSGENLRAVNQQGVTFLYPEVRPFQDICTPMHQDLIAANPDLAPIYEGIQRWNAACGS